jgi:hypothetical protein
MSSPSKLFKPPHEAVAAATLSASLDMSQGEAGRYQLRRVSLLNHRLVD